MLRGHADVEDVVQDAFERANTALRYAASPPEVLRIWLYRVTRNRCVDELRRRPPADADIHALSRLPHNDTASVVERRADVAQLVTDLQRLPEQQRSALLLRELSGLSHAELAATFGLSVGAVKSLLVRARMGLVETDAARGAACETIRLEVAATHERGVKLTGRARRHLRDCSGCRAYRAELRGVGASLRGLTPAPPLVGSLLAKLRGSGGHAGGSTSSGAGLTAASTGGLALTGKIAGLVAATAAVAAGGAAEPTGPAGRAGPKARAAGAARRPATVGLLSAGAASAAVAGPASRPQIQSGSPAAPTAETAGPAKPTSPQAPRPASNAEGPAAGGGRTPPLTLESGGGSPPVDLGQATGSATRTAKPLMGSAKDPAAPLGAAAGNATGPAKAIPGSATDQAAATKSGAQSTASGLQTQAGAAADKLVRG